tara:strand:- start:6050 stop:6340 length:291 start_codon:yes stop_codon:yes gene_type:complete
MNYYTELITTGFASEDRFCGFRTACAHFTTEEPVGSALFNDEREKAISFTGSQNIRHGWLGYTVGDTFQEAGSEALTVMSPAYSEGHTAAPVFVKV